MNRDHPRAITFTYTNHRGEKSVRTVTPLAWFWGSNLYHPQPQWLMKCSDHDRESERTMAVSECDFTDQEQPDAH